MASCNDRWTGPSVTIKLRLFQAQIKLLLSQDISVHKSIDDEIWGCPILVIKVNTIIEYISGQVDMCTLEIISRIYIGLKADMLT